MESNVSEKRTFISVSDEIFLAKYYNRAAEYDCNPAEFDQAWWWQKQIQIQNVFECKGTWTTAFYHKVSW